MLKKISLFLINFYQRVLSPDQGLCRGLSSTCRFYPTCSEYTKEAIIKHGLRRGAWLGLKRVSHCHPFNPGGFDPLI